MESISAPGQTDLHIDQKTTEKKALKTRVLEYLRTNCRINVEDINLDDLDAFRLFLVQKGISIKTANAYMVSFRSFFKFLRKRNIECVDPARIDLTKQKDRQVTFLDTSEVEKIFASVDTNDIQ